MKSLGKAVTEVRNKKGLTVVEAADRLKMSRMTLHRIESDAIKQLPINHIVEIANVLEADFFTLMSADGFKLIAADLAELLKFSRRITYKGKVLNKEKLEKLIKENLASLQEEH